MPLLIPLLLAVLGLIALAALVPPDGQERGDLLQFFGSLHPLAVHLPIALVLLVPVLEVAGCHPQRRALRSAAGFTLGVGVLSAIATPYLGWLLAWSGGFEGGFVTQHMWGGIAVAVSACACWFLRTGAQSKADALSPLYVGVLAITVLAVAFTGYRGGQLAHGQSHLTEHLPPTLQAWLGAAPRHEVSAEVSKDSFYGARVAPILKDHCVVCHGANKRKGGLRLDAYALLMHGGESGAVIKPGDATGSDLLRRTNLDPSDKDFMPAEGKPPLSDMDRKVLELWIVAGALSTLPVNAIADAPAMETTAALAPDYRADEALIARLASELNVWLLPRSKNPIDGLVLRTASAPAACDDAVLAKLAPVARYIVDAELARTKVTDVGAQTLTLFRNLRSLDLSHTVVSSAGVRSLVSLDSLAVLNVTATAVDDVGIEAWSQKRSRERLYVFKATAAQ